MRQVRKNGEEIDVDSTILPVKEAESNVIGAVDVAQDLNDRKQIEEERRSLVVKARTQSRLATLGEVATGVAHEINQPLTFINTVIQFLQQEVELDDIDLPRMRSQLQEARRQVTRIMDIVEHLRTFCREDDTEMTRVSLGTVLDNTLLLLGERARLRNIAVECRAEEDLPAVRGNASQLEQVFINLFQNSVDALSDLRKHGIITVIMGSSQDRKEVWVKFSDNGTGIPPACVSRIFEPFFTTKEVGQGTGLGLSIVYGIIQDHRGTITCESEWKGGTTMTITLPAQPQ